MSLIVFVKRSAEILLCFDLRRIRSNFRTISFNGSKLALRYLRRVDQILIIYLWKKWANNTRHVPSDFSRRFASKAKIVLIGCSLRVENVHFGAHLGLVMCFDEGKILPIQSFRRMLCYAIASIENLALPYIVRIMVFITLREAKVVKVFVIIRI